MDLDFLNQLLAEPDKAPRTRKPKDVRDYATWWKLPQNIMGTCSNPECISELFPELGKGKGRNRVTAIVNDHEMCRHCFLDGWHYVAP